MSLNSILQKYRSISFSERDKGGRFERLMQAYLLTDPMYASQFKNVWMWDEFPFKDDLGGKDMGIDLVALKHDNEYWAVQCKFYQETTKITKASVDSFLTTSSRTFKDENSKITGFSQRLWISTSENWGDGALDAFKGLAKNQPVLGLVMTVFLLAQAGMPLTSGFVAKFGVIQSAVAVGSYQLAVIAMVCAVIAAFVYLRIMVSMWLADGASTERVAVPMLSRVAIGLAVAFTLLIGFLPGLILDLTANLAQLATQ